MKNNLSVIVTVLNEEATVVDLLKSLTRQTFLPGEIVIVDGGSRDRTVELIKKFRNTYRKIKIKIYQVKSNRSAGRNLAVKKSTGEWLAITDAGCIPENNWLEELFKAQKRQDAPVVAGFYKGLSKNSFEKASIPYFLVMPDRVQEGNFLPATRSMLITKDVWWQFGGLDENLPTGEDYAFALKLKDAGIRIAVAKNAVVGWIPPANLVAFTKMIFGYAYGDALAGSFRPKVVLIFLRYFLGVLAVLLCFHTWVVVGAVLIYAGWSILKNIRYVGAGWIWLPVLQVASDLAVMGGSVKGLLGRLS